MNVLANKLKRFADKDYRDGYLHTHVRSSIAYQIKALRRKFRLTQREMAERTYKKQSVISRLESADYGRVSLQTLLDIASGLNVALVVRFVSYPDFLKQAAHMSEKDLQPETISESLAVAARSEWFAAQASQPPASVGKLKQYASAQSDLESQSVSALAAHNRAVIVPTSPVVAPRLVPSSRSLEMYH